MRFAAADAPRQTDQDSHSNSPAPSAHGPAKHREPRNFLVLAGFQIVMRTGWIFKTESIIMPAVLDLLGFGGWLRGCLPMLNRFGQSVPPLFAAAGVRRMPRKKWGLTSCAAAMSAAFLTLSLVWPRPASSAPWWTPAAFLALYALFFASTGVNQLVFGTLQGKLIQPTRRGRLLWASSVVGGVSAIACAALLMPKWLAADEPNFALFFAFAGVCFGLSALLALLLSEPADDFDQRKATTGIVLGDAWRTLKDDANFRRLAIASALFGTSFTLFPHYQAVGLQQMELPLRGLILWVIIQNAGTALFSLVAGPLADWRGYRLVLKIILLGVGAAPLAAIGLARLGAAYAACFPIVFLLVGMTPIAVKTLHNYALEISAAPDHPRYLSTLSLCIAAPAFASPVLGLLVDRLGFDAVFLGVAALLLAAWTLTFGLREPRHHEPGDYGATTITGAE